MLPTTLAAVDPLRAAYVGAFGLAALACFAGLVGTRRIVHADTRRGLAWLLGLSGLWALSHVGYLGVPNPLVAESSYMAGLVVGLAAVGAWLYLCSAYTGRVLHRKRAVRLLAVVVFGAIVLVKVSNPLHGLYYTTAPVEAPFPHLAVQVGALHWTTMGLAYALAFIGFFMLFELFAQVGRRTLPLAALVGLTGLPVVLDVAAPLHPDLLSITHSPLGVAAFAIGVLYLYRTRFEAIHLAGVNDDPTLFLDADGRVLDWNASARRLFPSLSGNPGVDIEEAVPELAGRLEGGTGIVPLEVGGTTRYYRLSVNPFTGGHALIGRVAYLTDVTHRERYRRELERQNDRLERFASMVSHDLRNPLNVATGRIELAREAVGGSGSSTDGDGGGDTDPGPDSNPAVHLEAAAGALDRMEELIEDLLALARQGQPIDETEPVSLAAMAEDSWGMVDTGSGTLRVEDDCTLRADPDRIRQLLENLLRNAIEHGGDDVTVRIGRLPSGDGIFVEDDGSGIPEDDRETVFETGYTTREGGTGFGLAIVREIAEAHGWSVRVTDAEGAATGARFVFTGVSLEPETGGDR